MPSPGLPPGKRRRSGRARTLTAKAQQHGQQEEDATYREGEDDDDSDAMEGVLMMTRDPVESIADDNEYAADSSGDREHRDDRDGTTSTITGN